MRLKDELVAALAREVDIRCDYLEEKELRSLYFGGGTPSLLSQRELASLIEAVKRHFTITSEAEITLEANPDDLSADYIQMLMDMGINRLSIGIQSFYDKDLEWMNRTHNSFQSHKVLEDCDRMGMKDISIDLIFGSPSTTDEMWLKNLELAIEYQVPHISCYALTVEKGTALHHFIRTKTSDAPREKAQMIQFELADEHLAKAGYDHYEISNYALPGRKAVHNTSYWEQEPYLGIGPSAHSFDGTSRQWNIANNKKYIDALAMGQPSFTREVLGTKDRFNEYLMTGLRTSWGCTWQKLRSIDAGLTQELIEFIKTYDRREALIKDSKTLKLNPQKRIIADTVISDLFRV